MQDTFVDKLLVFILCVFAKIANVLFGKRSMSRLPRLLRLRGVIARALPNALPEKSMRAIYRTPKICKFPHL